MPGRQVADVVFCLDASGSMGPCFSALRKHVQSFIIGLESGSQSTWDLRVDFLAYRASNSNGGGVLYGFRSLHQQNMGLVNQLYQQGYSAPQTSFFTSNLTTFSSGLESVEVGGDEATFVALDTALDFPWRESAACHRVVIIMTDEALETGLDVPLQIKKIPELIEKLHSLRVKLFIVGPSSDAFDSICAADRSEFQVLDNAHAGLTNADFKQILGEIGKSVSVSTLQSNIATPKVKRGLFGQQGWVASSGQKFTGD